SSRIIKFVADVSSSINRAVAPASRASTRFAAWEVEPEAFVVEKLVVSAPDGNPEIYGEISTPVTARPSSARILTASALVITHSRPSPEICGYTPRESALSNVDFP